MNKIQDISQITKNYGAHSFPLFAG